MSQPRRQPAARQVPSTWGAMQKIPARGVADTWHWTMQVDITEWQGWQNDWLGTLVLRHASHAANWRGGQAVSFAPLVTQQSEIEEVREERERRATGVEWERHGRQLNKVVRQITWHQVS